MRMMTRGALVATLVLLCTGARAEQQYRFSGSFVGDSTIGFGVAGDEEGKILAVTNARDHYSLVLPWTEDWVFTVGDSPMLRGTSGLVNLTLSAEDCGEPPELHLKTLQARLEASGGLKGAERTEIITFREQPVLRVLVDAAVVGGDRFKGVKMLHLHFARRWQETVYVLHLSRVIPVEQASSFDEKGLLSFGAVGFHVDFERGAGKGVPGKKGRDQ